MDFLLLCYTQIWDSLVVLRGCLGCLNRSSQINTFIPMLSKLLLQESMIISLLSIAKGLTDTFLSSLLCLAS